MVHHIDFHQLEDFIEWEPWSVLEILSVPLILSIHLFFSSFPFFLFSKVLCIILFWYPGYSWLLRFKNTCLTLHSGPYEIDWAHEACLQSLIPSYLSMNWSRSLSNMFFLSRSFPKTLISFLSLLLSMYRFTRCLLLDVFISFISAWTGKTGFWNLHNIHP